METFLVLNGFEISDSVNEQEQTILSVASGTMVRADFVEWLRIHVVKASVP
jgi:death-on-curing protein